MAHTPLENYLVDFIKQIYEERRLGDKRASQIWKHTAGWVNVRDYGAKCDDSTDDAIALAVAVASLPPRGGVILIPDNMVIGSPIILPNLADGGSFILKGSRPRVRITSTVAGASLFASSFAGGYKVCNIDFENLLLYGPGMTSGDALHVDGTGYWITFNPRNLRIENFLGGIGIYAKEVYGSPLVNILCTANSIGIKWLDAANACHFYNVACMNNLTYGAWLENLVSLGWHGGWIEGNFGHGLYLNGVRDAQFSQLHFESNNLDNAGKHALFLESTTGKNNGNINFISCRFTDPQTYKSQIYMTGADGYWNSSIHFINCSHQGNDGNQVIINGPYNIDIRFFGGFDPARILNASECRIFSHFCNTDTGSTISKINIDQEAWIAPTLLNSWVNFGAGYSNAGYFKDSMGLVHVRAMIKDGTINAAAFALPAGCRPEGYLSFASVSNGALGRTIIYPTGEVVPQIGSNVWFDMGEIIFKAA